MAEASQAGDGEEGEGRGGEAGVVSKDEEGGKEG